MYSENVDLDDYADIDLDKIPQRARSNAMNISNTINGIRDTSLIMPTETSSIGAQRQEGGTCYAFAAARLITRFITQKFPDQFEMNDNELIELNKESLEGHEDDCFLNDNLNIENVRYILTSRKCKNVKRYNHMLLFYFTLFAIKKYYGCDGGNSERVLVDFTNNLYGFYGGYHKGQTILSPYLDGFAMENFILPVNRFMFNTFINNTFTYDIKSVFYNLNDNSPQRNWILNFPEPAKRALKNKMYVLLGFYMPENQWETLSVNNIFGSDPIIRDTSCVKPIVGHGVVITKWEQEAPGMPAYITILNSWGTKWGNNGFIRISSENYYKFVMTPFCKKEFEFNGNIVDPENKETVFKTYEPGMGKYFGMKFTYFKVNDDKPFLTDKTGSITEPEIVTELYPKIVPKIPKDEIVKKDEIVPKSKSSIFGKIIKGITERLSGGKSKKIKYKKSRKSRKTKNYTSKKRHKNKSKR